MYMRNDYLVESPDRRRFDLIRHSDQRFGFADAVASERLPQILVETGMEDSFLAECVAQLAVRKAVDSDLWLVEGQTIGQEISELYRRLPQVEEDPESGTGFCYRLEREEDEVIWRALRGYRSNVPLNVLDRNGYAEFLLSPFDIIMPDTPEGSFFDAQSVREPDSWINAAISSVKGLRGNPHATHYMRRHTVTRNEEERPIRISDKQRPVLGWLNGLGEFMPYAVGSKEL